MASAAHDTEKPIAHQNQNQQQQQQVLKCPRCDSSNTKFCYYNNYSLSQPRHFCKACKRYWTRGGTLRNVPVGGGCRKNKRIKTTFTDASAAANSTTVTFAHNSNPNLDHLPSSTTSSNTNLNPLYGLGLLQQNPTCPRYTRVSDTNVSRHDLLLHPRLLTSLGLGFSSSDPAPSVVANHAQNSISSYPSIFSTGGSTASCTSTDPTMPVQLASSSLQQQPTFLVFSQSEGDEYGSVMNDVQMEGTKSRMEYWNNKTSFPSGSDGGDWLDPTSDICSLLPSLM